MSGILYLFKCIAVLYSCTDLKSTASFSHQKILSCIPSLKGKIEQKEANPFTENDCPNAIKTKFPVTEKKSY